jgi:hypothetical protein
MYHSFATSQVAFRPTLRTPGNRADEGVLPAADAHLRRAASMAMTEHKTSRLDLAKLLLVRMTRRVEWEVASAWPCGGAEKLCSQLGASIANLPAVSIRGHQASAAQALQMLRHTRGGEPEPPGEPSGRGGLLELGQEPCACQAEDSCQTG